MTDTKYRLTKAIAIPADSEVGVEMPHKVEFHTETVVVTIAVTNDVTAEWHMDLEEALQEGIVEEVEGEEE